jgi:hypothetical protein
MDITEKDWKQFSDEVDAHNVIAREKLKDSNLLFDAITSPEKVILPAQKTIVNFYEWKVGKLNLTE